MILDFDPASLPELIQGTPEWLAWRTAGIGSSEIATLMGESEYDDTPLIIWKRKKGLIPPKAMNQAMQNGSDLEPRARALYELDHDFDCPPVNFMHPTYQWAKASLDGFNAHRQLILEIKCNGREKFEMARAQQVPPCYKAQLQWQLFVTNAKVVHFVSLNPETKASIEVVPVLPDYAYWDRMIAVAKEFWKCIETNTPPPLTDGDYLDIEDTASKVAFDDWKRAKFMVLQVEDLIKYSPSEDVTKRLKERLREEKAKLEAARDVIQVVMPHPRVRCVGVKVVRRKGGSLDIRFDEAV